MCGMYCSECVVDTITFAYFRLLILLILQSVERHSSTNIHHKKVIRHGLVSSRLSVKAAVASSATSRLVVNVFISAHMSKCIPLECVFNG